MGGVQIRWMGEEGTFPSQFYVVGGEELDAKRRREARRRRGGVGRQRRKRGQEEGVRRKEEGRMCAEGPAPGAFLKGLEEREGLPGRKGWDRRG